MGRCQPGFGVKSFPVGLQGEGTWTSVYVATPSVPAPVLRGIARYAGVHLYNEGGDVLYATPDLLAVHTVAGGQREFRLPCKVEVIYDLFNRCELARDSESFQTQLAPASTAMFYTGTNDLLKRLNDSTL